MFEAFAEGVADAWPETAAVLRRAAYDALVLSLMPDEPTWDIPHRLVAAARWLALAGQADDFEAANDPWGTFRAVVAEHREWAAAFVREQPVQTNVVQRCFALLPLLLTVARDTERPLDLLELGTSSGLNLMLDHHRYRYRAGTWGHGEGLELTGEERTPVPAGLLATPVEVRRRAGVDLQPVDATTEEGLRLLCSFVHAGPGRTLLREAAATLRLDPPQLVRGDYLALLPALLAGRDDAALTVVFQTLSSVYLSDAGRARLRAIVDAAGEEGPLAWISTPTPEEHGQRRGDYPLEVAVWPGGERRIVARMDVRGEWLDWTSELGRSARQSRR